MQEVYFMNCTFGVIQQSNGQRLALALGTPLTHVATAPQNRAYLPLPPPPSAHTYSPPPGSSPHFPAARRSDCPAYNTCARLRWPAPASPRRYARRDRPLRRGPAHITPDPPKSPRSDPPSAAARADKCLSHTPSPMRVALHRCPSPPAASAHPVPCRCLSRLSPSW